MRALRDVRKVFGDSVGICADGHVSNMCALHDVRKSVGDSAGIVRR